MESRTFKLALRGRVKRSTLVRVRGGVSLLIAALALAGLAGAAAERRSDPADNLARVRLVVTTSASAASVTVDGATVASYLSAVVGGPAPVSASLTGRTLALSGNLARQPAEVRFDIILSGVTPDGTIGWNLTADANAETRIDLYSLNGLNGVVLVDRFTATGRTARFTTASALLDSADRVRVQRLVPRLVLAHYHPWYTAETWRDPQMADRPLRLYSTDVQSDVTSQAVQARAAGIDAFVVSWQGLDAFDGFNDRRMRIVLEAARFSGLRACAYTETVVANPTNNPNLPTDPRTMFEWLADLVDRYSTHPAYLRVAGRPVIFVYLASRLAQSDWTAVMARLRAGGRDPLLIGDFVGSTLLERFDGEYQYTTVLLGGDALIDFNLAESLRVRTYSLLRQGDRRRIWVAAITPGYDDSRLADRPTPHVVERSNGAVYDAQWTTAIDTGADWAVVTSWNEWWENTEIEPGERYGSFYLTRTQLWSNIFKSSSRTPRAPDP
jgi:Glycosyl hydrolase family 99